jgi:hypothetical protein
MTIQSSTQDRASSTDPGNAFSQAHTDRIRRLTFKSDLDRIDQGIRDSVRRHANLDQAAISRRIEELDREWPVERALMAGAGTFVWLGLILGGIVKRRLTAISAVAGAMLILFAIFGWVPPVLFIRRFGFRTRGEIDSERIALKILRGDFNGIDEGQPDPETRVERALKAARA